MSDEFKDARKKLEESLREMEILKRKALRLEDENKHLVRITINYPSNMKIRFDIPYFLDSQNQCRNAYFMADKMLPFSNVYLLGTTLLLLQICTSRLF